MRVGIIPPLAHTLILFIYFYFILLFINLNPSWLTYSVIMVSGVDTQCSSQVSSLMPIAHLVYPPLQQPSVCSLYLRVSYGLLPSLFLSYFSFPFPMRICRVP